MGMTRGSKWKRLAIFSDEVNTDVDCHRLCNHLRAQFGICSYEWWARTTKATKYGASRSGPQQIGRDWHPKNEQWLMVPRGNWPLAFIIARDLGVKL